MKSNQGTGLSFKKFDRLSNRQAAALITLGLLLIILLVFLPTSLVSIQQVVRGSEALDTSRELQQAIGQLNYELDRLDKLAWDYANWDDTYLFAADKNQAYIDAFINAENIGNLDINLFAVVAPNGEVVHEQGVDLEEQSLSQLPFSTSELVEDYPKLLAGAENGAPVLGIARAADEAILVASHPILTSNSEGPSTGRLIFAIRLDEHEQMHLSTLADRDLYFWPPDSQNLPGAGEAASLSKSGNRSFALDENTMAAFQVLDDLNGQPALILQMNNPRTLFGQGKAILMIYLLGFAVQCLILAIGFYRLVSLFIAARRRETTTLERLSAIIMQSSDAILLVNINGEIIDFNESSLKILRLSPEELGTLKLGEVLNNEFHPVMSLLAEMERDGGQLQEYSCRLSDGTPVELEFSASLIQHLYPKAYSLILRDITLRKAAHKALQESEERFELATRGANDGLWDWDLVTNQVFYSDQWKAMLGCHEDEISPNISEWFGRVHPEDSLDLQVKLGEYLKREDGFFSHEFRMRHKDGSDRWMLVRGIAKRNELSFAQRMAGSLTEITRQKEVEEHLRHDALHDALTGLGNRTLLLDRLRHLNERKRRRPELQFALLFFDMDRFKQVNDSFGHLIGDQILVEVARRLERNLRTMDTIARAPSLETIARIAGDEFVVLVEDIVYTDDVEIITDRLIKAIAEPIQIGNQSFIITASVGIVVPEMAYSAAEDIIRDADIAMYRVKQQGGAGRMRFTQDMYERTISRMQLENDMHWALERGEFFLQYQPIYEIKDDKVIGFEALVRWNHPNQGLLFPDAFIGLAEETGMIVPLGYLVMREACTYMKRWQQIGIAEGMIISVNLTSRELSSVGLLPKLKWILAETDFDPNLLWIEITETTLIQNLDAVKTILTDLRQLGVHIEIDDFGKGYSSLSYLQDLPVDGFKIDRSFIGEMDQNGHQIVNTLIELGRNLKLTHFAEGVETTEQRELLRKLDCNYMQGYLMSRPMGAEQVEAFLREQIAQSIRM